VSIAPDGVLAALQRGNEEAFRQLAEAELDGLYGLAYGILGSRADAEDVCQEVLLKLYQTAPRLSPDTPLRAWLRRVCVNRCLDVRRMLKRRPQAAEPLDEATALPGALGSEEAAAEALFRQAVTAALVHLPRKQRAIFVLRHLQECSVRETAQIMGCAEGTVKVQLSRAVAKLRHLLRDWRPGGQEEVHHA
jgi:RNA polymerase sigma-70 factor, ECF subfamily